MKADIAKKWIKALRSGKFKQAKHKLKRVDSRGGESHCCLGVLCELYQQAHKRKLRERTRGIVSEFAGKDATLPPSVMRWAGMRTDLGEIAHHPCPDNAFALLTLAKLNDTGSSFKQIAKVIEKNAEAL